jgi:hypothetical protein
MTESVELKWGRGGIEIYEPGMGEVLVSFFFLIPAVSRSPGPFSFSKHAAAGGGSRGATKWHRGPGLGGARLAGRPAGSEYFFLGVFFPFTDGTMEGIGISPSGRGGRVSAEAAIEDRDPEAWKPCLSGCILP